MLRIIIEKLFIIMKKIIQSLSIATTGLTIAIAIGSRPANALTFGFSQSGWNGGGTAIGTFSGEDKNGDNMIKYDSNPNISEVSAYEMVFEGNSNFDDFIHNLGNLDNLVYDILSNTATIMSSSSSNYVSKGLGNLGFIGQDGDSITTNQQVSVSMIQVPEPTSWKGLVFFGLGVFFTRKINTKFFE